MIKRKLPFVLLTLLVLLAGCLKEIDNSELEQEELALINDYLEKYNITVPPRASGLYYIETDTGTGIEPELGDYILIEFTGKYVRNEEIFATSDVNTAIAEDIYSAEILYGPYKTLVENLGFYGLIEGVLLMKEGGKAQLILPSYLANYNYIPLVYDIELLTVIKYPEEYEQNLMEAYLDTCMIKDTAKIQQSNSGLVYIEREAGNGTPIEEGDVIDIAYEGKLLDGRIFESCTESNPLTLTVSSSVIQIEGFLEGLLLMEEGTQGTLIIPYYLAYKETGNSKIPPYSTLVFDIKVLTVY